MNALVDSAPPVAAYSIICIHVVKGNATFAQGVCHAKPNGTSANYQKAITSGDNVQHVLPIEHVKLKRLL